MRAFAVARRPRAVGVANLYPRPDGCMSACCIYILTHGSARVGRRKLQLLNRPDRLFGANPAYQLPAATATYRHINIIPYHLASFLLGTGDDCCTNTFLE